MVYENCDSEIAHTAIIATICNSNSNSNSLFTLPKAFTHSLYYN